MYDLTGIVISIMMPSSVDKTFVDYSIFGVTRVFTSQVDNAVKIRHLLIHYFESHEVTKVFTSIIIDDDAIFEPCQILKIHCQNRLY